MAQFRAKVLDLGGYANTRIVRDHTKRKIVEQFEAERYVLVLSNPNRQHYHNHHKTSPSQIFPSHHTTTSSTLYHNQHSYHNVPSFIDADTN